jgi:hypothetical protein
MFTPPRRACGGALLLAAVALSCHAPRAAPAEGVPAAAPRDAAEKVQEGNVKNWIEYYQRTRPPPAKPAAGAPETPPAQPPALPAGPAPAAARPE